MNTVVKDLKETYLALKLLKGGGKTQTPSSRREFRELAPFSLQVGSPKGGLVGIFHPQE